MISKLKFKLQEDGRTADEVSPNFAFNLDHVVNMREFIYTIFSGSDYSPVAFPVTLIRFSDGSEAYVYGTAQDIRTAALDDWEYTS